MNKNLFLTAVTTAAAFLFASCDKSINQTEVDPASEHAELTVKIAGIADYNQATKASLNEENERKVNYVQIFVFRNDGTLEVQSGRESSSTVRLKCTTGEKKIYALVNAPSEINDILSSSELEALKTSLDDNGLDSFIMIGNITEDITSSQNITVQVKRIVARVGIRKISTNFASEAYNNLDFKITRIFMTNVAGDTDYQVSAEPAVWFNKLNYTPGDKEDFLYHDIYDVSVSKTNPYTSADYFYVYPNATETDTHDHGPFCPRYTRLVIETLLGGTTYYYPISIKGIERNKTYDVTNLVITRPGVAHPEDPISSEDFNFTIVIKDWEEGFNSEITI